MQKLVQYPYNDDLFDNGYPKTIEEIKTAFDSLPAIRSAHLTTQGSKIISISPREISDLNDFYGTMMGEVDIGMKVRHGRSKEPSLQYESESTIGLNNSPNSEVLFTRRSQEPVMETPQLLSLPPSPSWVKGVPRPIKAPQLRSGAGKPVNYHFSPPRWLRLETPRLKKKMELPITINGFTIAACPDSGSEENIIARDEAIHLSLNIEDAPEYQKEFRVANGSIVTALGRTLVVCNFEKEPETNYHCFFYVFKTLVVPLIIGMSFLSATETLTKNKHRLKFHSIPRGGPLQLYALNNPAQRIRCIADSKPILANADTGSELDLISAFYARKRGYLMSKLGPHDNKVQFADGSESYLAGKVDLTIIVGNSGGHLIRGIQEGQRLRRTFYVLQGLTSDMLLGEELLDETNAFETYKDAFSEDEYRGTLSSVNTIVWLKTPLEYLSRLGGRGNGAPEPLAEADAAATGTYPTNEITMRTRVRQWMDRRLDSFRSEQDARAAGPIISFAERLNERDAREIHRRALAAQSIAEASTDDLRQSAQSAEDEKVRAYEEDKRRLIQAQASRVQATGSRRSHVASLPPGDLP